MEKKVLTSLAVLFSLVQTSSANGVPEWVDQRGSAPAIWGYGTYTPAGGQWTLGSDPATFQWGWDAALPVPGWYGVGNDFAVYAPTDEGNWLIRFQDGTCTNYHWGWNAALPVPGDYNADFYNDLAVYSPDGESAGNWYLLYSDNGSYTNYDIVNWGYPGAIPVPADWDGTNGTEVAVYDNGTWYIRYWNDTYEVDEFGYPGCIPLPANLDIGTGDNKCDLVVVDPATYTWYVWLSDDPGRLKSKFVTFQFGYAGTVPYAIDGEVGVYDPKSGLKYFVFGFETENLQWDVDALAKNSTLALPQNVILKQLGILK